MEIERSFHRHICGELTSRSVDAAISALAERQYGVVARAQLRSLGVADDVIDHRIAMRRLHVLHRGVFAVGHNVLTRDGVWLAAVFAAGPDAVLSHRSAAALWEIRGDRRRHVDVIASRRVRRPHIAARQVLLPPDEVTTHHDIPVTTVARTLFDLAGVLTPQQLEAAITEAEGRRLGAQRRSPTWSQGTRTTAGSPRSRRSSSTPARSGGRGRARSSRSTSWHSSTRTVSRGRGPTPRSADTRSTPSGPTSA